MERQTFDIHQEHKRDPNGSERRDMFFFLLKCQTFDDALIKFITDHLTECMMLALKFNGKYIVIPSFHSIAQRCPFPAPRLYHHLLEPFRVQKLKPNRPNSLIGQCSFYIIFSFFFFLAAF